MTMPEWPEEADADGRETKREVSLHLEGTGKIWINLKDLEWFIRSLWLQQKSSGVDHVGSEDEGPDARKSMGRDMSPETDDSKCVELDVTPEKLPRPQEVASHLYEKWGDAP